MPIALLLAAVVAAVAPQLTLVSGTRSDVLNAAALAALPHVVVAVQDHGRTRSC